MSGFKLCSSEEAIPFNVFFTKWLIRCQTEIAKDNVLLIKVILVGTGSPVYRKNLDKVRSNYVQDHCSLPVLS